MKTRVRSIAMKQFVQMSIEKLPVSGKNEISLIGIIKPFVGCINALKLPLICRKLPFAPSSGFTLVELMVTLLVVGILVAFAMPNMSTVIRDSDLITQNNNLISDVNLARSEAIKNARTTRICTWNSTANPTVPACDGGGNWAGGRVIWVDRNNNGALDAGDIVRSRAGIAPLTLNQIQVGGNIDPIVINSRGQSTNAVNFALCDDRLAPFGKNLQLTVTGQIALFPSPPASCN